MLATWVAVSPTITPVASNSAETSRGGVVRQVTLDDLQLREANLRDHAGSAPLKPSTRNPFRFGKAFAQQTAHPSATPPAVVTTAAAPSPPSLHLSGIATEGLKRTAIISGEGQLYLVRVGEPVAGLYHVVSIDSNAAVLRGDDGAEIRLVLH